MSPSHRGKGLSTNPTRELIQIAHDAGLEILVLEGSSRFQAEGLEGMKRLGFAESARRVGHIRDLQGRHEEPVLLEMPLEKGLEWWQFSGATPSPGAPPAPG